MGQQIGEAARAVAGADTVIQAVNPDSGPVSIEVDGVLPAGPLTVIPAAPAPAPVVDLDPGEEHFLFSLAPASPHEHEQADESDQHDHAERAVALTAFGDVPRTRERRRRHARRGWNGADVSLLFLRGPRAADHH